MSKKLNVAFVCVHNSCRSQMAEAVAKIKYADLFNAYSAGTDMSRGINQDAVKTIINRYNYNMNEKHVNTHINDLSDMDIVITMGCNVECPSLKSTYRFDWGLDDPSGQSQEKFNQCLDLIETKMDELANFINERA